MNVTKTFLPHIEEYVKYLQKAYDKAWLTNRGELVYELEAKLKEYLVVKNLTLTTNGTLPLQIAIKALNLKNEIITTPFSYVATTSSIVWESCSPIFVDIESEYLTIDPNKIEKAITDKTSAILATHVFGNPCDVEAIENIAKRHNLKVIYDAAHCFAVKYNGESIFNYGDISTCSFHATKIFHTGEGGCLITKNDELHKRLFYQHNFGHKTPTSFHDAGINAKMSELQAAIGLAVFDHIDEILENRKNIIATYNKFLHGQDIQLLKIRNNTEWNYHYYPVIFKSKEELLRVQNALNNHNIYPRRYFYPSLNTLDYVVYKPMPISESIAKRILCLPLFTEMNTDQIKNITDILLENLS
ncbi:DegT/DnrJ/EryC1/StrS family aminotransferase [Flavobacteriaceae bacterium Ap0902]|nr:DegT/DnrJ/EryC1/StrS family aminotransferase [Flavobacteriaceae bacterium Ap0902]